MQHAFYCGRSPKSDEIQAVLANHAGLVERLYAETPDATIIVV